MAPAASATPAGHRPELIDYTAEEIRRLLHQTIWHIHHAPAVIAAQSLWRRTHQAIARKIHYERRRRQALEVPL